MPPKEPEQPVWMRILDRYGPVSLALCFVGMVVWYGGGWLGNEILKPALASHVKFLDTSTEVMKDHSSMLKSNSESLKLVLDYEARQVKILEGIERALVDKKP